MVNGSDPERPSGKAGDASEGSVSRGLDQRLNRLEAELVKRGALKAPEPADGRSETSASVAHAMKISSEFIAGVLVGALIGWFIDKVAGTAPWGLIVFLLLGFAAGVLNVMRSVGYVADKGDIKSEVEKRGKE